MLEIKSYFALSLAEGWGGCREKKRKQKEKTINNFNFFANPCLWHIFLCSFCLQIPACIVVQSYRITGSLQNTDFHIFLTTCICSDFFPGCFTTSLFTQRKVYSTTKTQLKYHHYPSSHHQRQLVVASHSFQCNLQLLPCSSF